MNIKKIGKFIEIDPTHLFYKKYTIWSNGGMLVDRRKPTRVQSYLDELPLLWEVLLKAAYYVITWPIAAVIKFVWYLLTGIFVPSRFLR